MISPATRILPWQKDDDWKVRRLKRRARAAAMNRSDDSSESGDYNATSPDSSESGDYNVTSPRSCSTPQSIRKRLYSEDMYSYPKLHDVDVTELTATCRLLLQSQLLPQKNRLLWFEAGEGPILARTEDRSASVQPTSITHDGAESGCVLKGNSRKFSTIIQL